MSFRAKSVSLILASLLLWHYGGVRLYAQVRATQSPQPAPAARLAPGLKGLEDNRCDALLAELREVIRDDGAKTKAAPAKGFTGIERLRAIKDKLAAEDKKYQDYFAEIERTISDRKLPAEIRQRHAKFVGQYQSKYDALMAHLGDLESAHKTATGLWGKLSGHSQSVNWEQVIEKATAFLDANTPQPRPRQSFDPHNLPHRSSKAEQPVAPKLTREEWLNAFPKEIASAVTTAASTPGPTAAKRPGTKTYDTFSPLATAPPLPADLAETIEVKFTPEIRQLADSLDRNPVKIYNWVRNNIEFVPVWGSIQGAQLCLETKSCNAFDTSSLLITLLRISGIPARYQMGTIEVPVERFKNWAGGFTNAEAAASLFASGGTPSVVRRVNGSGQVVTVRLEHVWVKAFVDYTPSGGAVNLRGNTWVEMDPGFKQHALTNPTQDLTSVVSFNRDTYLSNTGDQSPVEFYRQTLENFVQQHYPGMTLNDFLYKRTIRVFAPPVLGGTLPYKLLIAGAAFSNIPDQLRQQVTLKAERPGDASPLTYTGPLPALLGKRLTLSFVPATPSDVQVATSFEGLYRTPPYLMSVKPVLRVNGQEVATGAPIGMGRSLQMTFLFELPGLGQRSAQNNITAGGYLTILLAPHLINEALADKLAREFRSADDRFGTLNLNNTDRDPWVGGGLQVLSEHYFNRLDSSIGTLKELFPVAQLKTTFAAYVNVDVEPSSLFGAPAALQFSGLSIDADLLEGVTLARDGISGPGLSFEKLRGLESSFWEHKIFEPEGADPDQPAISTVRALQRAKQIGIPIHEVNAGNLAAIEPQLQVPAADREAIRDAVNAGLVVTTPGRSLQLGNWRGVGYIVEDPLTGAGAYQISGGLSGGAITIPLLQPHLTGGALPPGQPQWPTAILAVGWPVRGGALEKMIIRLQVNRWEVSKSIGQDLYSAGYNVYTADVDADTFLPFVAGTGARTEFDVFGYIGETSLQGDILLDNDQGAFDIPPSSSPRKFWVAYLSNNTGSICSRVGNTGNYTCSESVNLQHQWRDALIPFVFDPVAGFSVWKGAVAGLKSPIGMNSSKAKAESFWAEMAGGSNAEAAAQSVDAYVSSYPDVTLRGFGR